MTLRATSILLCCMILFPAGMLAAGAPAVVKRGVAGSPAEFWVTANPPAYAELAQRHRVGVTWLRD